MTEPNQFLQAALQYAMLDYRVFPCAPRGKRPITENGFKDATTDLEQIERWWTENPDANVAVATGGGLLVIDPDRRNGGDKTLETLEAAYGPLPRTCVAKTSDGIHIWLRYDGAKPPTHKSWPGVDFKHEGGYVVVAPSIHPSGVVYSFETFGEPARLPEAWAGPLLTPEAPSQDEMSEESIYTKCKEAVLALPECISGSFGHNAILRAACEIARWGVPPSIAHAILREYNDTKCFDKDGSLYPWDEADLKRKLKEGHRKALQAGEIGERLRDMKAASDLSEFEEVVDPNAPVESPQEIPRIMSYAALARLDIKVVYLVEGVMADKQGLVIGGREKTAKTGITLDLLASLHTGVPFLGKFKVNERRRSIFYTAEIGWAVAREKFVRICNAKGINPYGIVDSFISDRIPRFYEKAEIAKLKKDLENLRPEVAAFDPLYLGFGDADSSKIFEMGKLLNEIGELCASLNITPILNHHAKRGAGSEGQPLQLGDLSGAGIAEYARQWLLMSHINPFSRGVFDMWMTVGGSAGHNGVWRLGIDEGVYDGEIDGRQWQTTIMSSEDYDADAEAVLKVLGNHPMTVEDISWHVDLTKEKLKRALMRLCNAEPPRVVNQNGEFKRCDLAP